VLLAGKCTSRETQKGRKARERGSLKQDTHLVERRSLKTPKDPTPKKKGEDRGRSVLTKVGWEKALIFRGDQMDQVIEQARGKPSKKRRGEAFKQDSIERELECIEIIRRRVRKEEPVADARRGRRSGACKLEGH